MESLPDVEFPAALGVLDVGANWLVGGTGVGDDSGLAKVGSNTTHIQVKVSVATRTVAH